MTCFDMILTVSYIIRKEDNRPITYTSTENNHESSKKS